MDIFGLSLIKTSELKKLHSDASDLRGFNILLMDKTYELTLLVEFLRLEKTLMRTNSAPKDPETKRLMPLDKWPQLEQIIHQSVYGHVEETYGIKAAQRIVNADSEFSRQISKEAGKETIDSLNKDIKKSAEQRSEFIK